MSSTYHEARYYVIFSILLLLPPTFGPPPPQNANDEHPQPLLLPQYDRPSFIPIQKTGKWIVAYVLIVIYIYKGRI
jgi:hypothetical protein